MELKWVKPRVEKIHKEVEKRYHVKIHYKFGTMIETAQACLRAGQIAEVAKFFSFGTNDLPQGTFSFSREDAENKFLPIYNTEGILKDTPFEILDEPGVGRLMQIAVTEGRQTRPDLKIGIHQKPKGPGHRQIHGPLMCHQNPPTQRVTGA